ncbi:hypothetical protein JCM8208_003695 [Rhodotorula glutinis]
MHDPSTPASPSKRAGLLRQLVTGVQPTDRETHAQRWQRPLLGPRSPSQNKDVAPEPQTKGGQRVSALVQGYEASLSANSRRYEALPLGPTSPHKSTFALDIPASSPRALGDRQPHVPTSPTSPSRQLSTSPTVPAAYFQRQPYRSAPAEGLLKFAPAPLGKENQPRSAQARAPSVPRPQLGAHPASLTPSAPSAPPTRSPTSSDTFSSGTDVSRVTSAMTDLTMATRSSDSTHASSLVTNSAEGAYVGVASVVHIVQDSSPRKAPSARPPQIVETAATPARSAGLPRSSRPLSPAYITSHPSFQSAGLVVEREQHRVRPDGPVPFERPLLAQRSTSSFVEALPASYPRGAPSPSSSQSEPLPLDASPRLGSHEETAPSATRQQARRTRPRASSLGAGLKAPYVEHKVHESVEDKAQRVERDFERLLDTMQLPDRTVRTRMLGLALPLKEEMLRAAASNPSSSTSTSSTLGPPGRPTHTRGRSLNLSASQSSSGSGDASGGKAKKDGGGAGSGFRSFLRKAKSGGSLRAQAAAQHQGQDKDVALAVARPSSRTRSHSHSRSTSGASIGGGLFRSLGRSGGAAAVGQQIGGGMQEGDDALYWAARLRSATCAELEAKELGRLRARLRNEAPTWVDEFIKSGGYLGLLERLKELLDMEWREEQHDDQVLHELLRSFKALTMTACGKRALASHSPTPFLPVAALLFSEKRPGDLPSRQILVELLAALYDICPHNADTLPKSAWADSSVSLEPALLSPVAPSSSTFDSGIGSGGGGVRRYTRKAKSGDDQSSGAAERDEVLTPERVQQTHRFLLSLLEGPPSDDEENKVDFILAARKPRLYKTWVKEISDTVRDYFWIFCHTDNLFWTLEQIDAAEIEAPKVPSGMTGGVEHEAMTYCATHFRLINAIARACPTQQAAFDFHEQLFLSGFERVLSTLRRASLVYYQTLHLEMSRYISLARSAHFNLGPRILASVDRRFLSAEERLVLRQADERRAAAARSGNKAFKSHQGAPQIGNIF